MADPLLVEVGLGAGDWANISDRISDRSSISITRGANDEDATPNPGTASLVLDNRDGLFNVRNPSSELYGRLGRNSPLRISYGRGRYGLVLSRAGNGRAQLLDNAAISLTGDIDVRIDLELLGPEIVGADPVSPTRWKWPTAGFDLASKSQFVTGQVGWGFHIATGQMHFNWSNNGTNTMGATCPNPLTGADTGRRVLRATIDVDNGASGRTITFYQGSTLSGPWTQIGQVIQAGTTAIFDNTRPLTVGAFNENSSFGWGGTGPVSVYGFELRNGINGTVVASSDYTAQPLDPNPFASATWTDAQGNSWIPQGSADAARIWYGDVDTRFVGEIASLPNRFSLGLHDRYVPITANGILRRLGQGKATTASGLRDFTLNRYTAVAAYFPLDGAEGTLYSLNVGPRFYYLSTKFYAVNGAVFKYGIDLGGAIGDVMEINATGAGSYMRGDVGSGDRNAAFDFVFQSAAFGVLQYELQDYSVNRMQVILNDEFNGGAAQVNFLRNDGSVVAFSPTGIMPELRDSAVHHCRLTVSTSGNDFNWALYIDGDLRDTGAVAGTIWNGTSLFRMFYSRYTNQTYVNVGHLTLWSNPTAANIPSAADAADAAFGYAGDTAAERIARVADDGNLPVVIVGDPDESQPMGVLYSEPRLAQIRDAAAADLGILHETRDGTSLLYRTRASMVGQSPVLTLSFADKQIAEPLEPVDDDQLTRNDMTASRRDGGSYRVTVDTGRLSTQDPPFGAGIYADEVTVNVQTDAMLANVAAWLTANGTLDKARYPSITVELASPQITQAVIDGAHAVDVGDLIRMTDASAIGEYDDVDLIVVGYTETIGQVNRSGVRHGSFTYVCAPADVYKVARYGTARYDTGGTTLSTAATSTATSLSLATASGHALWTTDTAAFPLDLWVAGERVTATAISGTTSPQTATVIRSVNGVVKAQRSGAAVRLFDTPRYAL